MIITISRKLRAARKKIGMNQVEIAAATGLSQRDVSLLENAKREFIPTGYIQFLFKKGLDLNWLFNDDETDSLPPNTNAPIMQVNQHTTPIANYVVKQIGEKNAATHEENVRKILIVGSHSALNYPFNYNKREYLESLPYLYFPDNQNQGLEYRCFQFNTSDFYDPNQPFQYLVGKASSLEHDDFQEGHHYVVVLKNEIKVRKLLNYRKDKNELEFTTYNSEQIPDETVNIANILELWEIKGKFNFENENGSSLMLNFILEIKTQLNDMSEDIKKISKKNV